MIDQDAVRLRWVFENRGRQLRFGWNMDCGVLYTWKDIHQWRDAVDRLMEQENGV